MVRTRYICVLLIPLYSISLFGVEVREQFFREAAIRVLILSGTSNHDWRQSTPFLERILTRAGAFDVRINEEPAGLTKRTLAPYHLVVLDYQGPRWGRESEEALLDFVETGKGLVVFHGASYGFNGLEILGDRHVRTGIKEAPWPEFLKLAGGVWSEQNPKTAHGDRHCFPVKFVDREHPIARGMPETFVATDELYHDLRMSPTARILAEAYSDPATGGTGEDEPVLWTVNYGQGRVFHTTLGHDLIAMTEPAFISSFVRGSEWAATGQVKLLPTQPDAWARSENAVRALVVTGGHSYDTTFYRLFEGEWIDWSHATSNAQAYQSDLREKYEVLVLYDFFQDLDERGRANLRAFVESGKGLVVLHHALADYNSWNWWWHDVVGGRYIMESEDGPASTYQHDVELLVRRKVQHPVNSALGPMRIIDETYKNMWISSDVTVLLETDESTADGPLAWVSPYEKSRVVVIQLGHDHRAHLHPGYQQLVRNAILWAARGQ